MKKLLFFRPTYFSILKSIQILFFCPSLVTEVLHNNDLFFTYKFNTLKKSLLARG